MNSEDDFFSDVPDEADEFNPQIKTFAEDGIRKNSLHSEPDTGPEIKRWMPHMAVTLGFFFITLFILNSLGIMSKSIMSMILIPVALIIIAVSVIARRKQNK